MTVDEPTARESQLLDHVRVSQASREMAHNEPVVKFETYGDELKHYIGVKRECESLLSQLASKKKMAHKEIRAKWPKNCVDGSREWLKVQTSIEAERERLVARKHHAETQVQRLRPLRDAEALRLGLHSGADGLDAYKLIHDDGTLSYPGVAAEMLKTLRRIETLLENVLETSRKQ